MLFSDCQRRNVLLWSIAWAIIIVFGLELFFRSGLLWTISSLEPFFLKDYKEYHRSAFQIVRIKNRDRTKYDNYFVLLGGSASALYSITGDKEIADIISKKTERKIGFSTVAGAFGTLADYEKIIHSLADKDIVFVLGLEPYLFSNINSYTFFRKKNNRLIKKFYYLPPPVNTITLLRKNGVDVSYKEMFIAKDNLESIGNIIRKTYIDLINGNNLRTAYIRHKNPGKKTAITEAKIKPKFYHNFYSGDKYLDKSPVNFMLLKKIVTFCRERSISILFFELPAPDLIYPSLENGYGQYYVDIKNFTQKHRIPYSQFQDVIPWKNEYFGDSTHMRTPGREKFTPMLASFIASQIN